VAFDEPSIRVGKHEQDQPINERAQSYEQKEDEPESMMYIEMIE
jgi:hypothetical protein